MRVTSTSVTRGSISGSRSHGTGLVLGVTVPDALDGGGGEPGVARGRHARHHRRTSQRTRSGHRSLARRHRRQGKVSQSRTSCSQHPATRRSTVARRSWSSAPAGVDAGHQTSHSPSSQSGCTPPARPQSPFMSGFVGTDVPTNPEHERIAARQVFITIEARRSAMRQPASVRARETIGELTNQVTFVGDDPERHVGVVRPSPRNDHDQRRGMRRIRVHRRARAGWRTRGASPGRPARHGVCRFDARLCPRAAGRSVVRRRRPRRVERSQRRPVALIVVVGRVDDQAFTGALDQLLDLGHELGASPRDASAAPAASALSFLTATRGRSSRCRRRCRTRSRCRR